MPWLLSETGDIVLTAAHLAGQHNDYVLGHFLGLSNGELARLQADQAIF